MAALDLTMGSADVPIRAWLSEATTNLIREADRFSGKRPLGMSDWWWDLIDTITAAGLAESPDGAEALLMDEIRALYSAPDEGLSDG